MPIPKVAPIPEIDAVYNAVCAQVHLTSSNAPGMSVFHKIYALCHAGGMTSNAALSLLYGGCYDGFLEDTAAAASMHIETDPNPQSLFLHRVAVVTPLVRRSHTYRDGDIGGDILIG